MKPLSAFFVWTSPLPCVLPFFSFPRVFIATTVGFYCPRILLFRRIIEEQEHEALTPTLVGASLEHCDTVSPAVDAWFSRGDLLRRVRGWRFPDAGLFPRCLWHL